MLLKGRTALLLGRSRALWARVGTRGVATLSSLDPETLRGKRVLVRADLNVPVRDGRIADDTRITASLPTLETLRDAGARVVLCSHMGRPVAGASPEENKPFSLEPVAERLGELGVAVRAASDTVGSSAVRAVQDLGDGETVLLENVRFHAEETANDPVFARRLAHDADLFVNDAFGTAHRSHASTVGVCEHIGHAVAGHLMEREVQFLDATVKSAEQPFVAVLGGAKVSSKITVIASLFERCQRILIGGGMMFTFLAARGVPVGRSLVECEHLETARQLEEEAQRCGVELVLPVDVVATPDAGPFEATEVATVALTKGMDPMLMGLDIGPQTVALFQDKLSDARTVLWNGPMGVFEVPAFAHGTLAVAECLAERTRDDGLLTIVGGGDSVAALKQMALDHHITHVSTGGGASLEMLEGRVLPGVACLHSPRLSSQ